MTKKTRPTAPPRVRVRKPQSNAWKLLRFFDGKKTFIVVAGIIGYIIYAIEVGTIPAQWGLVFIAASLLPLTMKSGSERRHRELLSEVRSTGTGVSAKNNKTHWDE